MSKKCISCGEVKELCEFYVHRQMRDGHLNKCRECCLEYARLRRVMHHDTVTANDKRRGRKDSRKSKRLIYQRNSRRRDPSKYMARLKTQRAVSSGIITKGVCEVCGRKAEAHHEDYSRPLDVRWLCFRHHRELCHGHRVEVD